MDTVDILFVAADRGEFAGAMRHWRDVVPGGLPVHWSRRAIWKNRPIAAIANGAGPHRSALAAEAVGYRVLVNIGYCGALDPALGIGDIVVGDAWLQPRARERHVVGKVASIDRIAQTAEEKRRLRATGAIAVEMEAAGLGKRSFYCIKSVSDLAEETFANDYNAVLQPDGRMSIPKLLFRASFHPFMRIPELNRLRERVNIASNTLGEFLESCEF